MPCIQVGLDVSGGGWTWQETPTPIQIPVAQGLDGGDLPISAGPGVGSTIGEWGCWLLGLKPVLLASGPSSPKGPGPHGNRPPRGLLQEAEQASSTFSAQQGTQGLVGLKSALCCRRELPGDA